MGIRTGAGGGLSSGSFRRGSTCGIVNHIGKVDSYGVWGLRMDDTRVGDTSAAASSSSNNDNDNNNNNRNGEMIAIFGSNRFMAVLDTHAWIHTPLAPARRASWSISIAVFVGQSSWGQTRMVVEMTAVAKRPKPKRPSWRQWKGSS